MIAQELEVSLHMAFVEARQKRHEFITVEHLLLVLLDNPTASRAWVGGKSCAKFTICRYTSSSDTSRRKNASISLWTR